MAEPESGNHEHAIEVYPPDPMTTACDEFFRTHAEILSFVTFVTHLAARSDQVQRIAATALKRGEEGVLGDEDAGNKVELDDVLRDPGPSLQTLHQFRRLLFQIMVSRGVDNYLNYLSEVLALMFVHRPEVLRSGDQVRLDDVLRHDTMGDLIAFLAEQRVEALAYKRFSDLNDYLQERLGFGVVEDPEVMASITEVIEVRNAIVHSRGRVSRQLKRRVPALALELGDQLPLDFDICEHYLGTLARSVVDVDQRAAEKFDLPQPVAQDEHSEEAGH